MADREINFKGVGIPLGIPVEKESVKILEFPTSAGVSLARQALGASSKEELERWAKRSMKLNNHIKISVEVKKDETNINYHSENNDVTLSFPPTFEHKMEAQNLFIYFLIKLHDECVSREGILYRDRFLFKTSDLVKIGMYKNISVAKRAVLYARRTLLRIILGQAETIEGITNKTEDVPLFSDIKTNNKGECVVFLNKQANWGLINEYWGKLPPFFFTLHENPKNLVLLICESSRLYAKDKYITIDEQGHKIQSFRIPFRRIQTRLHLPSETTVDKDGKPCLIKKGYELIKKPIEQSVVEIEEAIKKWGMSEDFKLLVFDNDNLKISSYMEESELGVIISGEFLTDSLSVANTQKTIIEKNAKKKEKREEEAKTRALAKSMEQQQAASEQASEN